MKAFMKNEFLLAVLLGLLVLLFVHTGSDGEQPTYTYDGQLVQTAQDNRSVKYVKLFVGTVVAVYILLYLLSSVSNGSASSAAKTIVTGGGAAQGDVAAAKLINDSIDTLMKNIDICDPNF